MSSSSVNTPEIETEILLFNDQKKIQFRYRVHKNYTTAKEAVYFAFPVDVTKPNFVYASQQGWIDPQTDMFKGGSTEWFSIHQWMAVHDSHVAVAVVPLDSSLASFGDINRGKWPSEFKPQTGTMFSYAMNNYWDTNYRAGQSGDFVFRFTVTSSAQINGPALSRLGLEEMRPAELDYVVSQDKVGNPERPLPASGEGFLETSSENINLVTWKRAEDGNGTILRLAETGGQPAQAEIRFPHSRVTSANLCSGVEDNRESLPVTNTGIRLAFKPFQVLTVRVISK
jgi:alpha-mannosidase